MTEEQKSTSLKRTQEQLDHLAWLLDNSFRIPGTNWRFGLEAVIGLIPGAGDVVSGIVALVLLIRAFQFRLPKIVIVRMVLNTLLDVTVGAVPLLGDIFDFIFKSNTKNMKLFREYAAGPDRSTKSHWIFLGTLIFGFASVLVAILLLFVWALSQLR